MRIAALLPSATEMVSALGMAEVLVGVTHGCKWPPATVRELVPDLIITRDVGEVCAGTADQAREVVSLTAEVARVVVLEARGVEEILRNLEVLSQELGSAKGLEWLDPLTCTGGRLSDLIEAAGPGLLGGAPDSALPLSREQAYGEAL